jgi:DNA-binding CsgD family transcriptional regulator
MKYTLLWLLVLVQSFTVIRSQTNHEIALSYLDSSNQALTLHNRPDNAMLYTMQAEYFAHLDDTLSFKVQSEIFVNYRRIFNTIKRYDLYINYSLLLIKHLREETPNNLKLYFSLGDLGSHHYYREQYDSAGYWFKSALETAKLIDNRLYVAGAANNLGMYYQAIDKSDSAEYFYNMALYTNPKKTRLDSNMYFSTIDNIAKLRLAEKDTNLSIRLLKERMNYMERTRNHGYKKAQTIISLADLYLIRKKPDSVKLFLNKSDYLFNDTHTIFNKEKWFDQAISIKKAFIRLHSFENSTKALVKDYEELSELQGDQFQFLKEKELQSISSIGAFIMKSTELEAAKKQAAIENAKERQEMWLIIFCASLLLLGIFIFLVIVSYKRKLHIQATQKELDQRELQLTKIEKEKLDKELQSHRDDLSDMLMRNKLKDDWNAEIIEHLQRLRNKEGKIEQIEIQKLISELRQRSTIYDRMEVHRQGVDQVNSSFYQKLEEQFPDLTRSEKELAGMIRLNLDGKEIAQLRNIHPSSVRKLRYRLRKKLDINERQDIYEFVQKL